MTVFCYVNVIFLCTFGRPGFKLWGFVGDSLSPIAHKMCVDGFCLGLLCVFKLLLTLCHIQSAVERGFSVNSDTVTPNLRNETLVSLRTVYDALKVLQIDVSKFVVTKELIGHCRYESIVFVNGIKRNCLCI